jgi:hypothetical protein
LSEADAEVLVEPNGCYCIKCWRYALHKVKGFCRSCLPEQIDDLVSRHLEAEAKLHDALSRLDGIRATVEQCDDPCLPDPPPWVERALKRIHSLTDVP